MSTSEYDIAVLLAGSEDCGKTDFISSLLSGLKATRMDDGTFLVKRQQRSLHLHVMENDLAQFRQSSLPACVLLCYDTSEAESLVELKQYWHKQVLLCKPAESDMMPVMLLGLRRDLKVKDPAGSVDTQAALREGGEMRVSHYGECSAKTGEFMKPVAEDFLAMIKECLLQNSDAYSYCVVS